MKINLLAETMSSISAAGKTAGKIVFVGARDASYSCTWPQFMAMANITYDNAAAGQVVAKDTIIVFDDGSSLARERVLGTEKWVADAVPTRAVIPKQITRLHDGMGKSRTLAELNAK